MGQAAKKGSYEERKKLAIEQGRVKPEPRRSYNVDQAARIMAGAIVAGLIGDIPRRF